MVGWSGRLRRWLAPAIAAGALGCGSATHLTRTGELWISGGVLVTTDRALPNLALVRPERRGPILDLCCDGSEAREWFAGVAVRNFGRKATAIPVDVDVYVDGRLAASWSVAAPIRSGETVRNPSIPLGGFVEGDHAIRLVIDAANRITETMKSDNEYETTFTVPSVR